MVKYVLVFMTVMAVLDLLSELFEIVRVFRKNEVFKQTWQRKLLAFASIAYLITIVILGF